MVNRIRRACRRAWVERSFKREMATGILLFWAFVSIKHFSMTDPALVLAFGGAYSTLTLTVLPVVGLAFGVDAWWKQAPGAKT